MKYICVKDNIYGFCLWIYYDGTIEEAIEKFPDEENYVLSTKGFSIREIKNNRVTNTIWLRDWNNIPTLCHELLHFIIRNLHWAWIQVESWKEEPVCYLYEYYLREILKKMK